MNRLDEAAEALHQAQLLDPNNATTESLLGVAFSQEPGHEQDALAAFREASRLNPQMGLGTAMSQQLSSTRIQYLEELSEQSKRVEHNPGDAEAHYKLGMAQAKLGRPAEAFQEMQKAIQLRPGYGDAHAALARFYYMRREYSPAWDEVEKAKAGGTPPPDDLVQKLEKKLPKLR
jgi:Flp pilus assembly protein TadD